MMELDDLLKALPAIQERTGSDVQISRIITDSRQARPGDLFVAVPGVNVDGHHFIPDAVKAGVVAVVGERSTSELSVPLNDTFTYVRVPNAREAWGWLCTAWHGFPSRQMTLIGVTGTDGKTTTANLIHAILTGAGLNAGMVSTVSARIGGKEQDTGLHTTTPDPPDIQHYLSRMVKDGTTHAVLEVTSHGLDQHRVAGCDFDIAVVTNVTHEHLDYHGSLAAYRQAKARLFEGLTASFRKPGVPKVSVLNRDDDSFRYLSPIPADRRISYGIDSQADVSAHDIHFAPNRTHFALQTPAGKASVETPLVGSFNVSNALAAAATGVALELPLEAITGGIAALRGVPGRMERIDAGQGFLAIVDFAHTPNALQRALETARTMIEEGRRVIVVFGSAGLRDRQKRRMMGRVAGELADLVIVTAEDPRTESLDEIMAESAAAAQAEGKQEGKNLWRVPDRGEAILLGCQMARAGDVVIACGKGHEQSMCFGMVEYPWDDREAMRRALRGQTLDTLPTVS
jgi:UDP-N-acetylmuramoyl-L-alanyl-D-glutamate--2,6-diaminopimelate ligase